VEAIELHNMADTLFHSLCSQALCNYERGLAGGSSGVVVGHVVYCIAVDLWSRLQQQQQQLEKVAITKHCNLKAARHRTSRSPDNSDAPGGSITIVWICCPFPN